MLVSKQSVVAMLLEVGEENVAFLLARSELPDMLDTELDLKTLAHYGLDRDDVAELVRSAVEVIAAGDDAAEQGEALDRTISQRWADLVGQWVSGGE